VDIVVRIKSAQKNRIPGDIITLPVNHPSPLSHAILWHFCPCGGKTGTSR